MCNGEEESELRKAARHVLLSWCCMLSNGGQDPKSSCPGYRLRPAVDTEFPIDVAGMGLDGVQRDKEPGGNLAVGQALGDELEYL